MSFTGCFFFSIFSSGHHFVQPSGTILATLVEDHWRNTSVQILWNQAIGQGRDVIWSFFVFCFFFCFKLGRPSCSMVCNHCGHLGFSIDTILARFDPEVVLLLQSKFSSKRPKVWERYRKFIFKMAAVAAILDFLSAHLTILCLLGALMLIIKFWFNWIIEEMSKLWIFNIFPYKCIGPIQMHGEANLTLP